MKICYDAIGNTCTVHSTSDNRSIIRYYPFGGGGVVATTRAIMNERERTFGPLLQPVPGMPPIGCSDAVKSPSHYQFFPDLEAIEVIASSLTAAEYRGYCLGNRLKYRLRAGNKDKLEQDIKKSDFYVELYEKHKHLCKD